MKAGEGNPQAREEEGKLSLLSTECSSSLAGIPRLTLLQGENLLNLDEVKPNTITLNPRSR